MDLKYLNFIIFKFFSLAIIFIKTEENFPIKMNFKQIYLRNIS